MNNSKTFQPLFFYSTSIVGLSVIFLISAAVVSANGVGQQGGSEAEKKRCYAYLGEGPGRVEVPCPQPPPPPPPKKSYPLILDENTNPSSVSEGDISTFGEQTQQKPLVGLTNVQPLEQNSLDQGQSDQDQDQGQSDQDNQQ